MTTPTVTELVRNGNLVGERVELARYTVSSGQRIIYGQRVDGVVRITDCPAEGGARAYLVERQLEQDGLNSLAALKALVAEYLAEARRHDEVPMATSEVRRYLDGLGLREGGTE